MKDEQRRNFLKNGGLVLASGMLGGVGIAANAADMEHGGSLKSMKGVDSFVVDASEKGICATCEYWGGVRRTTEDKKSVYCESLGWCNNSKSRHYQTKTTPATGPMKSWKKWEGIDA